MSARITEALQEALKLCQLAETMTGCRSDDDFIAGVKAKVEAVLFQPEAEGNLDERMEAAGLIPLSKLLAGDTPTAKWEAHAGIHNLAHFEEWLYRRHREISTLRAAYALGDKDETDELYEWVLAHAGAFSEVVANYRKATAGRSALESKT